MAAAVSLLVRRVSSCAAVAEATATGVDTSRVAERRVAVHLLAWQAGSMPYARSPRFPRPP